MNVGELLLVSIGNTRTRVARCSLSATSSRGSNGERSTSGLQPSRVFENSMLDKSSPSAVGNAADLADAVLAEARAIGAGTTNNGEGPRGLVLLASVNRPVRDALRSRLIDALGVEAVLTLVAAESAEGKQRKPGTLIIPIRTDLLVPTGADLTAPNVSVGVDRLLCALAAFKRGGDASVVIDAGTAVTVDFVDNFGVFRGGAIAPGLGMMLGSLHEKTDALPVVQPTGESVQIGRNTEQAIRLGCLSAIRGLSHLLIDQYAQLHGSYPRVIATGGDAALLFENDELAEHIVPDLVLMGMHSAFQIAMGPDDDDADHRVSAATAEHDTDDDDDLDEDRP